MLLSGGVRERGENVTMRERCLEPAVLRLGLWEEGKAIGGVGKVEG